MPMSPWYDPEGTGETLQTNADTDALVNEGILGAMAGMFLGDASSKDPLANLLEADLGSGAVHDLDLTDPTVLEHHTARVSTVTADGVIHERKAFFPIKFTRCRSNHPHHTIRANAIAHRQQHPSIRQHGKISRMPVCRCDLSCF